MAIRAGAPRGPAAVQPPVVSEGLLAGQRMHKRCAEPKGSVAEGPEDREQSLLAEVELKVPD
jgi:hypothetical protein